MKVSCPVCGQTVQAKPCKGGDGTAIKPYAHGGPPGDRCRGSWFTLDRSDATGDDE